MMVGENDLILNTEEAAFKTEISAIEEELEMKKYKKRNSENMTGELIEYVDINLAQKYNEIFYVLKGNLVVREDYQETPEGTREHDYMKWAAEVGVEKNFVFDESYEYYGSAEQITIEKTGKYKLQVWGAEGGMGSDNSGNKAVGGTGGYAEGIVQLEKGDTLFIFVGGKGADTLGTREIGISSAGGFNGGADGGEKKNSSSSSNGGGRWWSNRH